MSSIYLAYSQCLAYLVFPIAHSTHPKSGPKVSVGSRISNGRRPSRRRFCLRELYRNSFSGIEGDGGRGMVRGCGLSENEFARSRRCLALFDRSRPDAYLIW